MGIDYQTALQQRRAKQFGFKPEEAKAPEEVTDSKEVKHKKKTKKEE